jgi:predicted alpha/beta hydrolase
MDETDPVGGGDHALYGQRRRRTAAGGTAASAAQASSAPPVRVVDLTEPDGTPLKGSYFAAARPGPGVLLLHQVNRERKSWDRLATQLAAAGIHALTLDMRGHGASGGQPYEQLPRAQAATKWSGWPADIEVAFQYLVAQPGVTRDVIGLGGAGVLGVDNAVRLAKAHPAAVKSLVLLAYPDSADAYRGEIRRGAQKVLEKLDGA